MVGYPLYDGNDDYARRDPRYDNRCTKCGKDEEFLYGTEFDRLCTACFKEHIK